MPPSRHRVARRRGRGSPALVTGALSVLALGAAACVRGPDPVEIEMEPLHVYSVLEAGTDLATVLVTRPPDPADTMEGQPRQMTDATVLLIHEVGGLADTAWAAAPGSPEAIHCASGFPGARSCHTFQLGTELESGEAYRLVVELPDGTRATGETTIPPPAAIASPADGTLVPVVCLDGERCGRSPHVDLDIPIAWSEPPGIRGVVVSLRLGRFWLDDQSRDGTCAFGGPQRQTPEGADSITWSVVGLECRNATGVVPFDSIVAEVRIQAADDAIARYNEAIGGSSMSVRAVSDGLEGAYGLFAGISSATRRFMLVSREPGDAGI